MDFLVNHHDFQQALYNVLDNVKQITGEPPFVRVGADSEDHTDFDPNVEVRFWNTMSYVELSCFQFEGAIFPDVTTTVPYPEGWSSNRCVWLE